jgi:hypothetical protein
VELEALRQQLEQVSRRMLTVTRQQHTGACRCLETTQPAEGSARRALRQHQRSSGDP